ncbi:hypothetical protein GCM10022284_27410 [Streptomyces hundungensis]
MLWTWLTRSAERPLSPTCRWGRGASVGVMEIEQLAEYRYQAVLEALGGSAIGEVAARYGTSRQTLHS